MTGKTDKDRTLWPGAQVDLKFCCGDHVMEF